ncbi:acyltransferase family protein [Janibacter corallicola]|uniref:acyltransferase family protein n=1 Tax=Janibacter corallicola TaxID=415212 RepID=UPI000832DD93|nr:acyltransferase family protein [Janibacter corallicola]
MTIAPARPRALPWTGGRDHGVDLVRGIAVVCMVIAHVRVWAPVETVPVRLALLAVNNVASPLFAVIMGISAGIVLTRPDRRVAGAPFVRRNVVRGLLLVLVGVGLEQLDTFVAIVLQSLGVTLVVAASLVLLPLPLLTAAAAVTFAAGPAINAAARAVLDPARVYSEAWVDQVLQWVVLSPHYRLVSLLPFVLIGAVLARRGLGRREALASLVAGLVALVAVVLLRFAGWGIGVSDVVSGGVPDALLDVALTGCALGVILLLARAPAVSGVVTALAPVRAVGVLALTAYVVHVGLIALASRALGLQGASERWPVVAGGVLLLTVLGCWTWWRLLGRGPVERAMAVVTDRVG